MIRHIVMWKLKDNAEGADKQKNAEKLKMILEGLPTTIKEIQAVEVGIQINPDDPDALDVVLISDFETELDLKMYTRHASQQRALSIIHKLAEKRLYVDYIVDREGRCSASDVCWPSFLHRQTAVGRNMRRVPGDAAGK